jgi:DNA ligase-1
MKRFGELVAALDETNKTTDKVAALAKYFYEAPPADAAWGLYFLMGRKPRQAVPVRRLAAWACESADVPQWLFDECYDSVGDLAETIAHILPPPTKRSDDSLAAWIETRLLSLRSMPETAQRSALLDCWDSLAPKERFVWNKLITGSFRLGVAQGLVLRGLSAASGIDPGLLAQRLTGDWVPSGEFFTSTVDPVGVESETLRPYPFFLAHPLNEEPASLGDPAEWQAEWKWDGIRAQFLSKSGRPVVWSRGEELITERFPELHPLASMLPDGTILDGELLPFREGAVLPFAKLQTRIGRKTVGKKLLADVPVVLMAYDLLALGGEDWRPRPLHERRTRLEELASKIPLGAPLSLSPTIPFSDWASLAELRGESRSRSVEGIMLKRRSSPYRVGRVRGDWWKWKLEPFTVDAVLTAAQRGHGKRASLYTDYTFSVWREGSLVTFAKAYSGLDDAEILKVDRFVREHTLERFGPVRTVEPRLVFELGFEGIARSKRHKSGVAVRFPRILRWRTDKKPADADTLDTIVALLDSHADAVA